MAHLPTDAVKAAAAKVVTAGVTRVVTTLVDPAGTAKRAAAEVRDLPRQAARLPLRIALGGLVLVEKVRTTRSGRAGNVDPASRVSDEGAAAYIQAQEETDALATQGEPALDEQADAVLATPHAQPVPAAPVKAPAAKAPAADSTRPDATVTPIHAGRDGHREVTLPVAAEAAVEAAPAGASLTSAELPLAGYDGLSLAQVRGRLSKLDVVALTQLRDYERAHADRLPLVTMLENRIAKVAESAAAPPVPPAPAAPDLSSTPPVPLVPAAAAAAAPTPDARS